MGTIDSATMMNKGLEVIEAKWFFGVDLSQIEVLVHAESIIHSMVEFIDGSLLAQLGIADMRVPIQYALTYPDRLPNTSPRLDFSQIPKLHFEKPDFLEQRIGFMNIPRILGQVMDAHQVVAEPKLEDILESSRWAKIRTREQISNANQSIFLGEL